MSYESPYAGLRVLDLSQGVAAPQCTMLLAQHGADVVKVEPVDGDWSRRLGATYGEQSALSVAYNLGKRSIALDLKCPEAVEVVLSIAARADVVVESFRPGVVDRLGVGYEAVKARNPRVVYLSVSGFGQTGPYRERPCSDTVAQAYTGFMSINRGPDRVPHKVNTIIMDAVTGLYAFQAVAAALAGRADEPAGVHLDLSLGACGAAVQASKVAEAPLEDGEPALLNSPAGTYQTADGWLAVTLTRESHFAQLCQALELDALALDPRFATFADRAQHHETLRGHIAARLAERDTAAWQRTLRAHDVLCERVMSHADWLADAQVQALGQAPAVEVAGVGAVPLPLVPGRSVHRGTAPAVGEHGREVLAGIGMDEAAIGRLVDCGAVRLAH